MRCRATLKQVPRRRHCLRRRPPRTRSGRALESGGLKREVFRSLDARASQTRTSTQTSLGLRVRVRVRVRVRSSVPSKHCRTVSPSKRPGSRSRRPSLMYVTHELCEVFEGPGKLKPSSRRRLETPPAQFPNFLARRLSLWTVDRGPSPKRRREEGIRLVRVGAHRARGVRRRPTRRTQTPAAASGIFKLED